MRKKHLITWCVFCSLSAFAFVSMNSREIFLICFSELFFPFRNANDEGEMDVEIKNEQIIIIIKCENSEND